MANTMLTIHPYRKNGDWVFDDSQFGLIAEPFVCGASEMIDAIVANANLVDAEMGFRMIFSAQPFPGFHAELVWNREHTGGNWYRFAGA